MAIVTITRPNLSNEERSKRMDAIKQAATRLVIETEKAKQRKPKKIIHMEETHHEHHEHHNHH